MNLCGNLDEHLRQIEQRLLVQIYNRGSDFSISGEEPNVILAKKTIKYLYNQTKNGDNLTPEQVHLALQQITSESNEPSVAQKTVNSVYTPNGVITLRNQHQKNYIGNILSKEINFGIGPAGTGKTFLAVACAVAALEEQKVRRIVLVRPVVETGERLGFLPGDISQKIDPYLRPLYDALYEMFGFEKVAKLLEQQTIEIAPLAYMRGRTLSDSFIILDESQNTTIEQMQMFLTRIGFGSKVVLTGDVTQIDLPKGKTSGLKHAIKVLEGINEIGFNYFNSKDVVRHNLVQKIIDAYGKADKQEE